MAALCSSLRFIITIIAFQLSVTAQQSPNRNVTLPSSIVAENSASDATTWTSPSGEFAFGFRQVAPGAFLLAVWFDRTPEKTLIWSANRDDPVPAGSSVQLSVDGALELVDRRGQRKWRANQTQSGVVAYAAMLDTGNFVLAAGTSAVLWQSFDFPTDTLLPSQVLSRGGFLVSAFSELNNSRGKFKLTMQPDGNLVLDTISFPMDDKVANYWSSETYEFGFRLVFNTSGGIHLIAANGTILRYLFGSGAAGGQLSQQRLALDYDGVLRYYVYTNSSWSTRAFLPSNVCLNVKEEHTGGGACGFNGICSMGAADGRPSCSCPPHYSPRGGLDGCAPDFEQHRCDREREDAQHFTLSDVYNKDWPFVNYAKFVNAEEEWCRQSCLRDCYCVVAVYKNGGCYKKSLPFSNGREDSGFTGKAFVKVRINNATSSSSSSNKKSKALVVTLSVLLGCSLFLVSVLLLVFCRLKNKNSSIVAGGSGCVPTGVNMISSLSLKELEEATNGFNEELGRGACSIVYKGTLKVENGKGKVVAVKKLHRVEKEADIEFIAEVSSISRTNHKNLVQLLGYCNQGKNRILVYEYMTNGSLASFLFERSPKPKWQTRLQIGFEIARGLCYLHEECSVPIIHCDIKPQNVLLDECLTPQIADFGLAKLLKPDQTRTTTGIRGTRGYVAPEWFKNMAVTAKVDVYSFGILLLELLCCRKNYVAESEQKAEVVLADWAYDCYVQGDLNPLVEGDEEAKSDTKMLKVFVKTAIWCIQEDPSLRPGMRRVMHMLEGSIQVPDVPNPTTSIS